MKSLVGDDAYIVPVAEGHKMFSSGKGIVPCAWADVGIGPYGECETLDSHCQLSKYSQCKYI